MTAKERAKNLALLLVNLLTESGRLDRKELGVLKELEARRVVDQFVAAEDREPNNATEAADWLEQEIGAGRMKWPDAMTGAPRRRSF